MLHELNALYDGQTEDPHNYEGGPGQGEERSSQQQMRDAKYGWNEESERQQADEDGREEAVGVGGDVGERIGEVPAGLMWRSESG